MLAENAGVGFVFPNALVVDCDAPKGDVVFSVSLDVDMETLGASLILLLCAT